MLHHPRRLYALFDRATRLRFVLAVLGSAVVAVAEIVAVIAVLPLMTLIAGGPDMGGMLARLKEFFGYPSPAALAAITGGIVLTGFVVKALAALAIRWWSLGFINQQGAKSAAKLFGYYLRAPMSLHVHRGTADLLRTLNEALGQVYGMVIAGAMAIASDAIMIVALTATLLIAAPIPALGLALYFVLVGWVLQRIVKSRSRAIGDHMVGRSYIATRTMLQGLGGIKEIKLRNEQEMFVDKYYRARRELGEALTWTSFLSEFPRYVMEIFFVFGIALATGLLYATGGQQRGLGLLALFAVAGFRIMPSVVRILASINVIRAGLPSLDIVERDLQAADEQPAVEATNAEPLPYQSSLEIDNVGFRYSDSDVDVLREVSLRVPRGRSLALVGASGAGKSTLVDLILGLQSPTAGRILVDGTDIAGRLPEWQANLAMVPQDVFLLDSTLRDNIRFSLDQQAGDDAQLAEAVRQAQLEDIVADLPDGLDTQVGDRGMRLSGGQRQRVGVARALHRRPALLVLDEATSALDNATERRITDTIDGLSGTVSVIVVAHRLSTVRHCDQIAFMESGRVSAIGTFEELVQDSPGFAHLVALGSLATSSPVVDQAR